MSHTKERVERYLASGEIELSEEDVEALEKAGEKNEVPPWFSSSSSTSSSPPPAYSPPLVAPRFSEKEYDDTYDLESQHTPEPTPESSSSRSRPVQVVLTRLASATLFVLAAYILWHASCLVMMFEERRESAY